MGCDIHLYVERFDDKKKRWVFVPGDQHYDDEGPPWWGVGRNYVLFGVLAGVRAPLEDVEPIARGRGVPKDSCKEIHKARKLWNGDAHSETWMTLAEARAFDWHRCDGDTHVYDWDRKLSERKQAMIVLAGHPLSDRCGEFLKLLDKLEALGHPHDKVRIVCWFDN